MNQYNNHRYQQQHNVYTEYDQQQNRKQRSTSQPIFYIQHQGNKEQIVFSIRGTTGKEYSVHVRPEDAPVCTCPDYFRRQKTCKHGFFVQHLMYYRSKMKLSSDDGTTISSEIIKAFLDKVSADFSSNNNDDERYYNVIKLEKDEYGEIKEILDRKHKRASIVDEQTGESLECSICYEVMTVEQLEKKELVYCVNRCGQNVHRNCMQQVITYGKSECIHCREPMKLI